MPTADRFSVLHYTGYDDDRGGIVSVMRALAATGRFDCVLGANPGCAQHHTLPLPVLELPRVAGEKIGALNFWWARAVARAVTAWLRKDPRRIFHGHSRAGLLVALWLHWWGERRVVVSVHCYGRQRWFYRWAARRLGGRLFWLSPAMRAYYGALGSDWEQCIPGGVSPSAVALAAPVPGRLRLGGVGALVRRKGWQVILDALAQLPAAEREKVSFTHIGGGDVRYRDELQRRVRELGLAAQVDFRDPEPDSARLLGEVDALVVASRNEPFSIAMLEALAAGVPVLAADSGGARDIIREGVNGRLHPTGNAAALAEQIREWLAVPPAWDRAVIRGSTVPIDRVAEQWKHVYAGL